MRKENLWIIALVGCAWMTPIAIDSVQTGIAGIASSHLLNRPTTPFWIGMTVCVGGALAFYIWLSILVRDALHSKKRLAEKMLSVGLRKQSGSRRKSRLASTTFVANSLTLRCAHRWWQHSLVLIPQDEGKAINESIKDIDFSEGQWQEVDQKLFAGMPLLALWAVLEFGKPSLRLLDAQEIMFERYANLHAECPAQFVEDASTYWADWDTD